MDNYTLRCSECADYQEGPLHVDNVAAAAQAHNEEKGHPLGASSPVYADPSE